MSGLRDDEITVRNIELLCEFLYARPRETNILGLGQIIEGLPQLDGRTVEQILTGLSESEIIEFDDRRETVRLLPDGRRFHELKCVPEVVFGLGYSDNRFSRAVVRIVIRKVNGDPGAGSGFFIAGPPNHIVTNRHIASNEIVQIENLEGRVVSEGDLPKILAPEDLDLAAISCQMPDGVIPIRIDWDPESARPLHRVLLLGYPYVANHAPALFHAEGKISMVSKRLGSVLRTSLVISDVAARGCSGGPVLNIMGRAIGIVAREEEAQTEGHRPLTFLTAIPSFYLNEFLPR